MLLLTIFCLSKNTASSMCFTVSSERPFLPEIFPYAFSTSSSFGSNPLDKIKSGELVDFNQFSARVSPAGFKPATAGAEIQCAIQLRHGAIFTEWSDYIPKVSVAPRGHFHRVERLHTQSISCATGPFANRPLVRKLVTAKVILKNE